MAGGWDDEEEFPALGTVLDRNRGSLPFALIHGESLVACASFALEAAGVLAIDDSVPWAGMIEADELFVLHDCLCPLTPGAFIASCVRTAVAEDVVVIGVDPEAPAQVWSPIVLPAAVCAAIADPMGTGADELISSLTAAGHEIRRVPAPAHARRIGNHDDVLALGAATTPEQLLT